MATTSSGARQDPARAAGDPGDDARGLVAAAADLGVKDALVFRRIGPASWAHVGGLGRGAGWAGIVDIDEGGDALAGRVPATVGAVDRADFAEPRRVLGPYYATSSTIVRVSPDVAVILGRPDGTLAETGDEAFVALATRIDAHIADVGPSKRLADELEVLTAVRQVMDAPIDCGLAETIAYVTEVATRALSCEVGVARIDGTVTAVGDSPASDGDWGRVLDEVEDRLGGEMWCAQDMTSSPSSLLTALMPTARAVLAAPIPAPIGGVALYVHTAASPRGFSGLCRRIVANVMEAGVTVARTAALRDELRSAADRAAGAARTDPLTGLGNRLAWDEATGRAQEAVDAGATYSVVSVDVDGLKEINDTFGHVAGDELLCRCAAIIRQHCSDVDFAVRIGGDEFAVLVPHALGPTDPTYVAFKVAFGGLRSTRETVAASLGVCTVPAHGSLSDAIREADMRMYAHKRQRRRDRAATRRQWTRTARTPLVK